MVEKPLKTFTFFIGTVLLVIGIVIIAIDQPSVSAVESIFGGWAMMSPEYQEILRELMFGYTLAVIGFILTMVGAFLPLATKGESISSETLKILQRRYAKGELLRKNLIK